MANLIFQTAFIGDALLATPLIKGLRKAFPDEPVHIVCRPAVAKLFRELRLADRVYPMDKNKKGAWAQLRRDLRRTSFQRVFCPHESFRSAWFLRSVPSDVKVGFRHWWNEPFFNHRVRRPMHLPDGLRQLSLLSAFENRMTAEVDALLESKAYENPITQQTLDFSKTPPIPAWASMTVNIPPDLATRYHEKFSQLRDAVLIAPGSVWATKRWTLEGFAQVADHYVRRGVHVALVGSADEAALCTEIQSRVPGAENLLDNLAGKTNLTDLLMILTQCRRFIGNDSGTMHLAAMAGAPTTVIFGPTTLDLGYRPWNDKAVVVQTPLSCRPCGAHGHDECPIGTHACMNQIPATEVLRTDGDA